MPGPSLDAPRPARRATGSTACARALRNGPAPLLAAVPGMADRERLHLAFVVPTFNVGSGGHYIIFQLIQRLERMGHTCSIWVHDLFGTGGDSPARCCAA